MIIPIIQNYHDLFFLWNDYPGLVDWSGRIIREDRKGDITEYLPTILLRLKHGYQAQALLSNQHLLSEIIRKKEQVDVNSRLSLF